MNNRFCDNERCDLHVNFSNEEDVLFPITVRNHLEFKKVRRHKVGESFYCDRCIGVIENEIERRKGEKCCNTKDDSGQK